MSSSETLRRFYLSKRSILDTLFVLQSSPRRPTYATTTNGSVTILWSINHRGKLLEVARIHWEGSSSSSHSTVVVNGQTMFVENILQRSKSFFGSESWTFAAGTTRCKWKCGKHSLFRDADSQQSSSSFVRSMITPASHSWSCHEIRPPSGRSPANASSSSVPIAVFSPPQAGLVKYELTVYPAGFAVVDHIILTAILIAARKDEWRTSQSEVTRSALEASLKAEIRGALPPYVPTTPSRNRISNPPPLRRPHSTNSARSRYASPPPYTSVDDTALHRR